MTIRIITGTITDAKDVFGILKELKTDGFLIQWIYTKYGWQKKHMHSITNISNNSKFSIIQPVGAGKTVLGATYSYISDKKGIRTGGNLELAWSGNKIISMKDFEDAHHTNILIDDIRRTIMSWNTKDAKMVSEIANASGKKQNWIDITTQRIQNFVPPDLMMLCDEIIVPYIRAKDMSVESPRGQGKPIQIIAFKFSPGYELLSYKVYNYNNKTGNEILNGFDTLQLAESLKVDGESRPGCQQPGYDLEIKVLAKLKELYPNIEWQHLNGKHVFDIVSDKIAIDVVGMDYDGMLLLDHKDLHKHMTTAKAKGQIPFLIFERGDSFGARRITRHLNSAVDGKRIKPNHLSNSVLSIESIIT